MQMIRTASGTSFGVMDAAAPSPAPTLLLLAGSMRDSLEGEPYSRVGRLLAAQGWLVASLDLPCHGADCRTGEPDGLAGWCARLASGEDLVEAWCRKAADVIDHLVATGRADPLRLAAAGTSRGGFMAFHAAVAIPRIRAVAAFAPVTDLRTLAEFAGMDQDPLTLRQALSGHVASLANRAAWITIGSADTRVGTDKAIAFARRLTAAAADRGLEPRVTLHVVPVPGHTSLPEWHDRAAAWLRAPTSGAPTPLTLDT
jgi:dienelactone hydrolase